MLHEEPREGLVFWSENKDLCSAGVASYIADARFLANFPPGSLIHSCAAAE